MPESHVSDLVPHDARQFRFIIGSLNDTPVDIKKPPGEGKCIDSRIINAFELVWVFFSRCVRCKFFPKSVQVVIHAGIVQHRELLLGILGDLPTQFHILLRREHIKSRLHTSALPENTGYP